MSLSQGEQLQVARAQVEYEHGIMNAGWRRVSGSGAPSIPQFVDRDGVLGVMRAPDVKDADGKRIGVDFYFQMDDGRRIDVFKLREDQYANMF